MKISPELAFWFVKVFFTIKIYINDIFFILQTIL